MADPVVLVEQLLASRPAVCGRTQVVAVDGPSGSGKSVLAADLAQRTGATLLRVDELVPGWHGLERVPGILVHDVLEPLSVGEVARPARWSWVRDRPSKPMAIEPPPVLVLDGCGSGSRVVRPFLSVLVWLDGPESLRRERAMSRDGEAYEPWWDVWAAQERRLFPAEGTAGAADVRVEVE
ncbi:hypothetical protein ASD11_03410 [Aeromicrobium sp. Root495]|uniref:(d)CMP kinase n=1 Tax=Aeromicrobium sp. Root495 TaxID=1736550 RepID=UPI0006FEEEA2|nr:(d)CMP kinase [Aeromicrobium sp. Root495]KQY58710.1 hypothetical protein ASD11_03410 [Aeromicrobium sp. Root495]